MNDIIVTFARLWGQQEAYYSTPEEQKISDELKSWDSQECLELLTKWAKEYMASPEEDTCEFFARKVAELL